MMKTEEEARKCWCPFARGIQDNGGNRLAYGGAGAEDAGDDCADQYGAETADMYPCIASECMAWRWSDAETKQETECVYDVDGKEGPPPDGGGWTRGARSKSAIATPCVMYSRDVVTGNARRGFCGLAVKP